MTTNDNLAALALYQKAGWRLGDLRPGAIDELRRSLKASIPEIGEHGIPLRDELELDRASTGRRSLRRRAGFDRARVRRAAMRGLAPCASAARALRSGHVDPWSARSDPRA